MSSSETQYHSPTLAQAVTLTGSPNKTVIISSRSKEVQEGGLLAWFVVAGAFFVWLNTWGAINAYGG